MITGVVLARNEEINIAECLQALRSHVDELILIDMESEDRTRELAGPLVDRILHHPVVDGFDAARNIAIPEAKHDWFRTQPIPREWSVGRHLTRLPTS